MKAEFVGELYLEPFPTFEERFDYLNKYFFNSEERQKIRNPNSSKEEFDTWYKLEKQTMNKLTNYLLQFNCEMSVAKNIERFFSLERSMQLSEDEKKELNELSENVIYYKSFPVRQKVNNVVLYRNDKVEQYISNCISHLESIENRDYTQEFVLMELKQKVSKCERIKMEVIEKKATIDKYKSMKNLVKDEIKLKYNQFREEKDKSIIDIIISVANEIKFVDGEVLYLEELIRDLCNDYFSITEFFCKIH